MGSGTPPETVRVSGDAGLCRREMAPGERLNTMSALTVLGVLLVLLGHSDPTLSEGIAWRGHVLKRVVFVLYTFHMALFFFIAGHLYCDSSNRRPADPWGRFMGRKCLRLGVPYLLINSLAYPLKAAFGDLALRPVAWGWEGYLHGLMFPGESPVIYLWFLPSILTAFAFAPAARRVLRWHPWAGALVLLAVGVASSRWRWVGLEHRNDYGFLAWRRTAEFLVFFWLGMASWEWRAFIRSVPWAARLGLGLSLWMAGFVTASRLELTAPTLMGLGGVVAAQALAERLAAGGRRILPSIEASSQTIFMLSWFPQVGAHFILGRMLGAGYWVVAAAMFLAGLLLPLGVAAWVRRKGFQWRWVIGQ